jgi:hypothetical protein
MGCAKDLVEHCAVPRFAWSDSPLGNSCGKPFDDESQRGTLSIALGLLEHAFAPQTTVATPYRWSNDHTWKRDFWHVETDEAKLAATRMAFEEQKATHKQTTGAITA